MTNTLVRIYKSGRILYSTRQVSLFTALSFSQYSLSLVLSCLMFLHKYPMDTQRCALKFTPYIFTIDDVNMHWTRHTPVQLMSTLSQSLTNFQLYRIYTQNCHSKTNTSKFFLRVLLRSVQSRLESFPGTYSCLRVKFVLRRGVAPFLRNVYAPSAMLVVVSWLAFWLPKSAITARAIVDLATLLTLVIIVSDENYPLFHTNIRDAVT